MGEQPESKIQLKAEEAICHSEGDETLALKTLEDWVGSRPKPTGLRTQTGSSPGVGRRLSTAESRTKKMPFLCRTDLC